MTGAELAGWVGLTGGVTSLAVAARSVVTARQERRRLAAEAEELELNTATQPLRDLIDRQRGLIDDLENRVSSLRQQLLDEREAYDRKIAAMRDDITTLQKRIETLLAS